MKLAERLLTLARGRFEAGDTGKLDVNLAQASVFDVQQQRIILRGGVRAARSDLARVLGLARWDQPWTLGDGFPEDSILVQDEAALLDLAMRRRLDVQAAAMQVRAAEDNIRRQILEIFPNVTLEGRQDADVQVMAEILLRSREADDLTSEERLATLRRDWKMFLGT